MNVSDELGEVQREQLLTKINAAEVRMLFPLIFIYAFILIVGVIGNALVLLVYSVRYKHSPARIYILYLASIDCTICLFGLPYHLIDLTNPYTYTDELRCQILTFIIASLFYMSIFGLIVIAIDRYLKICRPLSTFQVAYFGKKRACVVAMVTAVLLSWPNLILYGPSDMETPVGNLTGHACFFHTEYLETSYPFIYTLITLSVCIFCMVFLAVVYTLICHHIIVRYKGTIKQKWSNPGCEDSTLTDDLAMKTITNSTPVRSSSEKSIRSLDIAKVANTIEEHVESKLIEDHKEATRKEMLLELYDDHIIINEAGCHSEVGTYHEQGEDHLKPLIGECVCRNCKKVNPVKIESLDTNESSGGCKTKSKVVVDDNIESREVMEIESDMDSECGSNFTDDEKSKLLDTSMVHDQVEEIKHMFVIKQDELSDADGKFPDNLECINSLKLKNGDECKESLSKGQECRSTLKENVGSKCFDNDTHVNCSSVGNSKVAKAFRSDAIVETVDIETLDADHESRDSETVVLIAIEDRNEDCKGEISAGEDGIRGANVVMRRYQIRGSPVQKADTKGEATSIAQPNRTKPVIVNKRVHELANGKRHNYRHSLIVSRVSDIAKEDVLERRNSDLGRRSNSSLCGVPKSKSLTLLEHNTLSPHPNNLIDGLRIHTSFNNVNHSNRSSLKLKQPLSRQHYKITKIMLIVTTVFVISYTPALVVTIWSVVNPEFWDKLTEGETIVFEFLLRFYLLNNICNPFIYGFWDRRFKREVMFSLRKVYRRIISLFD